MAKKRVVRTERAPAPFQGAPYSQAIVFGDLVFVSGQVAIDPETHEFLEGGIAEQTELVMRNIGAILEEAGSSLENVLKCTIFLADFADFQEMNDAYRRFVGENPPARATVEIASLPSGARVEIDAIAHV
ncbi:MAG: Rid family detoxifying hydrolase [Actinomycetota bacterium]|nr:Rid family detoxifying hydrolase [Actinomycetota bacterium]